MKDIKEQKEKARALITNSDQVVTELTSSPDTQIQISQIELLNTLFENIALDHLTDPPHYNRPYNEARMQWLALALKAQKQCTDLIKTKAASEYMKSLTTAHQIHMVPDKAQATDDHLPAPERHNKVRRYGDVSKNDEQTDEL
tara:strand:+ start:1187 stop:1615 length:429 start_codon:yes stop_codon:yes gene_type:complete